MKTSWRDGYPCYTRHELGDGLQRLAMVKRKKKKKKTAGQSMLGIMLAVPCPRKKQVGMRFGPIYIEPNLGCILGPWSGSLPQHDFQVH